MPDDALHPFDPDWTVAPGDLLREELSARGMTQARFADLMRRPTQVVNEIINAKKAITPETAMQMEAVLGSPAEYWLACESRYRLDLLRGRKRWSS